MKQNYLNFFLLAGLIVILDQISKIFTYDVIFLPFLALKTTLNTGAAFGILKGQTTLLIWVSIIIVGIILFYLDKIADDKVRCIAASLILGGALGNMVDRIFLGHVRDFISIGIWPSFNIADAVITMGIIVWIWTEIKYTSLNSK